MISIITVISIIGVAAGVMALVIALGVNNGFRSTLQRNLLGAMAHINVMPKEPGDGIDELAGAVGAAAQAAARHGVSPALYDEVYVSGALRSTGALLKGVDIDAELRDQRDAAPSEGRVGRRAARSRRGAARDHHRLAHGRRTPGMTLNSNITVSCRRAS